jgi:hypothetical protein
VASVSKWNVLLGKEATSSKESHFDANNEEDNSTDDEDGIAMADVVDTTEFPRPSFTSFFMCDRTSSNKLKRHPVLENNDNNFVILCSWRVKSLWLYFLATSNSMDTSVEPRGASIGFPAKLLVDLR